MKRCVIVATAFLLAGCAGLHVDWEFRASYVSERKAPTPQVQP